MNKNELIDMISQNTEVSKVEAKKQLETVIETFAKVLAEGEEIKLTGFGTFSVVNRDAREGRNPQTGEAIQIPSSKSVKFKVGKSLKDVVNDK